MTKNGSGDWLLGIRIPKDYTVALIEGEGASYRSGYTEPTLYTEGWGLALPDEGDILKTGYTFDGWFTDSGFSGTAVTEISFTDTGDKIYYAKWTADEYIITYNTDGGIGVTNDTYTIENAKTLPTAAEITKQGYVFAGWYEDENLTGSLVTEIPSGSTGDKVFYAKWELAPTNGYSITYILNGGSGAVNGTYDEDDEAIILPTAEQMTREGYTFAGWYVAADFSGLSVAQIPSGSSGNKVLYAKWVDNTDYGKELNGLDDDKRQDIIDLVTQVADGGYVVASPSANDTLSKYLDTNAVYDTYEEAVTAAANAQIKADGDDNVAQLVDTTLSVLSEEFDSIASLISGYEERYADAIAEIEETADGYLFNGQSYDTLSEAVNAAAVQAITDILDEAKTELVGEIALNEHKCDGTLVSTQLDFSSSNIDNVDLSTLTFDASSLASIFNNALNSIEIRKYYQEILNAMVEEYNAVRVQTNIYTLASLTAIGGEIPTDVDAQAWIEDLENRLINEGYYSVASDYFDSDEDYLAWFNGLQSGGFSGESIFTVGAARIVIDAFYDEWRDFFTTNLKMIKVTSDDIESIADSLISNGSGFADGDTFVVVERELSDTSIEAVMQAIANGNVAFDSPEIVEAVKSLRKADVVGAYDLLLMDASGVTYTEFDQSVGTVTVTLNLPDELAYHKNISIVYLNDDGEIEYYSCLVSEGKIIFTTTHFSHYYLLAEAPVSAYWMLLPIFIIALLVAAYVLIDKVKINQNK